MRGPVDSQGIRDPERVAHLLRPEQPLEPLLAAARAMCLEGHGDRITYSPKAFLPLTQLCRDNCGYCTFAKPPRPGTRAFMMADEILGLARTAAQAGTARRAAAAASTRPIAGVVQEAVPEHAR